ncbi:MAG: aminopeptidase P family N-terminal domain-containing protein, partial [Candidatus Binatia bacterium]
MHPTLLVGPYDWDPERLPTSEFVERIRRFRQEISNEDCAAAIIYGDSANHAELVYLSHFVPKLGPAVMLIPRSGEPRLLASGAPNMLAAAKRLTWIEDVEPLRDAGKTIGRWLNESTDLARGASGRRLALIGEEYMPAAFHRPLMETLSGEIHPVNVTPRLRQLMRYKSPTEVVFICDACAILDAAAKALIDAHRACTGITAAVIEAERVALQLGAQDVRSLFSVDGGRTLRPFQAPINSSVDPLQAYIAVKHIGYWVEGFLCFSGTQHPAREKAAGVLRAVLPRATAGTRGGELARLVGESIKPYIAHPITGRSIGNGMGLSIEEEPQLSLDNEATFEAGCVYT